MTHSTDSRTELDAFLRLYEQATNSHDFDQVVPLLAPEATYFFSDGTYRGITEIRGAFEKTWAHIIHETYTISDISWIATSAGLAACTYILHWKGIVQGVTKEGRGRGTNMMQKADGRWLMLHEHLSSLS